MSNTQTQTGTINEAGTIIANAAMKLVSQHPKMTVAHIDAVVAAMKMATPAITEQLLADLVDAPTVANWATQSAVLGLAQAGMKAIQ